MTPTFLSRAEPLVPKAMVARGQCARALARRLDRMTAEERQALQVVALAELLIVIGPEASLPWVDGVTYLGSEAESPALFLPTTLTLSVAGLLVERAVRRVARLPAGPFALLSLDEVVPLARAAPLSRAALAPFLEPRP